MYPLKKIEHLSCAEVKALLELVPLSEKASLKLWLMIAGVRVTELAKLKWADIDFNNRIITVDTGIGRKDLRGSRDAHFWERLFEKLAAFKNASNADFVFKSHGLIRTQKLIQKLAAHSGRPVTVTSLRAAYRQHYDIDPSPHALRFCIRKAHDD